MKCPKCGKFMAKHNNPYDGEFYLCHDCWINDVAENADEELSMSDLFWGTEDLDA